ncbi:hypothetical protein COHA_009857 [Chlorella ohadii]|uniref:Uncharacterized protein n=1 Tax=Chlorella ohadii TaxID=2649997 RepID=A0AAD5DDV1_9CHLO|nr:hypothetical protein COHA_009857 [Chlorella ohadii]
MRALLCLALLALLAAPALAGGGHKPGPKPPKPFKVSGAVFADNRAINFAGKRVTYTPDADNKVDIVSNLLRANLTWQLVGKAGEGSTPANQSIYSVNWAFGAVVKTEINTTTGALSVELIDTKVTPIRPCKGKRLGPLVTITYEAERHRDRKVEIVVKPFIKIELVQKYIKPLNRWVKGTYATHLDVFVTLTEKPKEVLTGVLPQGLLLG